MSTKSNEKNDLYGQVNSTPGKESDTTVFEKELDALLNKAECSVQEAVEVMTTTARHLRRKYAGRQPWVKADYCAGQYLFWLGNCNYAQLLKCRKECDRLRRILKQALRHRRRCQELIDALAPANLDRLKRERSRR